LSGSGTWDRNIVSSGTLSPGDGVGTLSVRDVTLSRRDASQPATLALEIASATSYDRLLVRGTIELSSFPALTLEFGYDPEDGVDSFLVVANEGSGSIAGHFQFGENELEEGESFLVGNQALRLSYTGGDGNDLVLYAIPEPNATLLLLVATTLASARRRGRRAPAFRG
jgi:hypothetical protein